MLDTPGFFESRWTRAEWGRATDKHISMLQVLWPGHKPSRFSTLATPMQLADGDLVDKRFTEPVVEAIALQVEVLRSKSVAVRHANIAGHLRSSIERLGGKVEGLGQRRTILLNMPSGAPLVAHPSVGVPTAVTLHEAVRDGDERPTGLHEPPLSRTRNLAPRQAPRLALSEQASLPTFLWPNESSSASTTRTSSTFGQTQSATIG